MSAKNLFLFLALIFSQGLFADTPTVAFNMPKLAYSGEWGCTLPPPSYLNVDNVGSNWVQLSWPVVLSASQYRIQVIDENTGGVLSTRFVPGNSSSTQASTDGSTGACHAVIWSVCIDGTSGPGSTVSASFNTIILDLVGSGYQFPAYPVLNCTVGLGVANGCSFDWSHTETSFRVKYLFDGLALNRNFSINVDPQGGKDFVHINIDTLPNSVKFYISYGQSSVPSLLIKYAANGTEIPIAELSVANVLTIGQAGRFFKVSQVDGNCIIEKVSEGGSGHLKTKQQSLSEREDSPEKPAFAIMPNPFQDMLRIQLSEAKNPAGTSLRLYDLLGSIKRSYTADTDQTELDLNTADLRAGVYFLQIESGGNIQSVRVIKI